MRYYIKQYFMGTTHDITETQFKDLMQSKLVLQNACNIEEKYDLLLSSYLDLEKDVLAVTAENMVRHNHSFEAFYEVRALINRRLLCLLTSARLYIERIPSEAQCVIPNDEIKIVVTGFLSEQYDFSPEYRFVEALRNSVQHFNLPIHTVTNGHQWVGTGTEKEESLYTSSFKAKKSEFEKDKCFKRKVYDELPDEVDLIRYIRVYLSCLSHVHFQTRELIEQEVGVARSFLEDQINEYKAINNGDALGLELYCDDGKEIIEKYPLILNRDDIRISLVNRNIIKLTGLEKRVVKS